MDRIGAEVTVVGTAGAVVRLGIYDDDGSGLPGALVVDAGTIAGTVAAASTITISQAFANAGWRWLAACVQGAAGTRPTMRMVTYVGDAPVSHGSTPGSNIQTSYVQTGVAGALPNPAVPSTSANVLAPRAFLRGA